MYIGKMLVAFAAAMLLSVSAVAADAAKGVTAGDAWVRLVPPVARNSAAYMVLDNKTADAAALVSAQSDAAEVVEVHETSMHDGVMRMQQVKSLVVESGAQVELKPGGYHIMLINLKQPLKAGSDVNISLTFDNGQVLQLSAPVKAMAGKAMDHSHHHKHH